MTARDRIRAKPKVVQTVLKMRMTTQTLALERVSFEKYGNEALTWWEGVLSDMSGLNMSETDIALSIIEKMRERSLIWRNILGGQA